MTDVFISYSRGDKDRVRILAEELERSGLKVWWDSHLTTGHAFRQEISEKLDEARLIIVIWSRLSVASRFVCDEADEGAQRGTLLPALIELVDIPLGFRQIQTADLTRWHGGRKDPALRGFVESVGEAAAALGRRRGAAPPPAPAPAAAPAPAPAAGSQPRAAPKQKREKAVQSSPPRRPKPLRTVTGKSIRAKLVFNALVLATLVAGGFGAMAYTSDFVFPELRIVLIAAIFGLTFLSRFASFAADKAMGSASMRLMSGSFVTLFGLAALSIAPLVTEGRLYAGALEDVRIEGIEGADINGVAIGPGGKHLVTASDDGQARIWDATTGVGLGVFALHENWVWSADFSPDGSEVATASRDRTIRVWNVRTRKQRLVIAGHDASVYDAKFSPDGAQIASGSGDGSVRLWDATTGDQVAVLSRHEGDVRSVAFSPNGAWLASGSADGKVLLWNVENRAFQRTIGRGSAQWNEVAFDDEGNRIGAVGADGSIRVWNVRGDLIMQASVPGTAFGLAFLGGRVAVGSIDSMVRVFDIASGAMVLEVSGHGGAVRDIDAHPSSPFFATGSRDNTARVWDAADGQQKQIVGHIASALHLPMAVDLPPVAMASRAPQPLDFRHQPERTGFLLAKGVLSGFAVLLIGLLLKALVSLTPAREAARMITPVLFVGAVGYYALLMLSALPVEAAMLWGTLAFVPATVFALVRWLGATAVAKPR